MESNAGKSVEELIEGGLAVIDRALSLSPHVRHFSSLVPLFSGGYDSLCACYIASRHPKFGGRVYHIDTGIGSKATRRYVEEVCEEFDWKLEVYRSDDTYEKFVTEMGFPGPGAHQWAYVRLKERCVRDICDGRRYKILVTGCRHEESERRMGHVEPVKWGEVEVHNGRRVVVNTKRVWIAPCHDWTSDVQGRFVTEMGFPRNPIKDSILGMSGECFCGAFARPNELEMIEAVCPDVYREIKRLEQVARDSGVEEHNCTWGYRPKGRKPVEVVETGPLCNSCDRKARAAGVVFKSTGCSNVKDPASSAGS